MGQIWRLSANSLEKYRQVRPIGGLFSWIDVLNGSADIEGAPLPLLEVVNKSKPKSDFVSSPLSTPILSEHALAALTPLIAPFVKPIQVELDGWTIYVIKVTSIQDILDEEGSDLARNERGEIYQYYRYAFNRFGATSLPPIFKVRSNSDVFVTNEFAESIIRNKLRGASLEDPTKDELSQIVRGESRNIYPGLIL